MLTGEAPFVGKSSVEVLGKQVREAVVPPCERAPGRRIPEALENIVMRAMSKKRDERFPSAVAMRRALEEALRKAPPKSQKRSWMGRALVVGTVACGIAVVSHAGTRSAPVPSDVPRDTLARETESAAPNAPDPSPLAVQPAPFIPPATDPIGDGDKPPRQDRAKDRLESARAAAHQKPGDPRLLRAWATAAVRAGDLRDARRAVDTWILHDSTPEPRVFLASVLDASGKHQEARAVLEEILETHPDSDAARRLHAKLGAPLPPPDTAQRRSQVAENW